MWKHIFLEANIAHFSCSCLSWELKKAAKYLNELVYL